MNYYKLGKLPNEIVSFFRDEILKRKKENIPYQWIHFDKYLNDEFFKIFINENLIVQKTFDNTRLVQKAFYSDPGHGFRIHKDGIRCKSALNIAISCNSGDWVRWYDENHINTIGSLVVKKDKKYSTSRDIDIIDYENVAYIDELKTEVGDVYVLDVDKYHSFKCNGLSPRIVIQTKFDGWPDLETIYQTLKEKSFLNLIR